MRYLVCCQEHGWIATEHDRDHAEDVRVNHLNEQHGGDWDGEILVGEVGE